MSFQTSTTFEEVAARNMARLQRLGIVQGGQTVDVLLLQMMAALGELAALSCRSSLSLSPFEREEAAGVIGRLAASLTTIGSCLHVDVGAAALAAIGEEKQECGESLATTEAPSAAGRSTTAYVAQGTNGAVGPLVPHTQSQSAPPPVVLSPTSRESFFTYLDQLAGAPRSLFDKVDLRWVAPDEAGRLVELIPSGADTPVAFDLFHVYYNMARSRGRGRGVVRVAQQPPVVMGAPECDPATEAQLLSPAHISGGLFSPRAALSPAQLLGANLQPRTVSGAGNARVTASEPPVAAAAQHPYAQVSHPPTTLADQRVQRGLLSTDAFDTVVARLRSGAVPPAQIASLGLTFCFPDGDRLIELIHDGMQVAVTAANCSEFLRLHEEYRRSSRAPAPERIHRLDSVRRLQPMVTPAPADAAGFSPSHFKHGLFAPYPARATFYVDYDAADRTLPPYLKHRETQRQGTPSQEQPRAKSAGGVSSASPASAPAESPYMAAVRASDYAALSRMIAEVHASADALTVHGVTFCVPSSLERNASPAERLSGVHELFANSSQRLVQVGERHIFLALVRPYFSAELGE